MRHYLNLEFRLYGSTYSGLAYPAPDKMTAETAVRLLTEIYLVTMAGDIYIFRTELHKWPDRLYQPLSCNAFKRRYYLY